MNKPIIKQTQKTKIVLRTKLQKTLHILSLQTIDLQKHLIKEYEKNPLLEKDEFYENQSLYEKKSFSSSLKNKITDNPLMYIKCKFSLFNHLFSQIKCSLKNKKMIEIAKYLIGMIDEKGFLTIDEKKVLKKFDISSSELNKLIKKIQYLDPLGIATRNVQEFYLFQLEKNNKKDSLIYKIIRDDYKELIQQNLKFLSKKYNLSKKALFILFKKHKKLLLKTYPLKHFSFEKNPFFQKEATALPDIFLYRENNHWIIEINKKNIPSIRINEKYLYLNLSKKENNLIYNYYKKANSLLDDLENREKLILKIMKYIIKKQHKYFLNDLEDINDKYEDIHSIKENSDSYLKAMNLKEIAVALDVNISTISRAISNKFLSYSRGIIPLKSLFITNLKKSPISKNKALNILKILIEKERKNKPLSDVYLYKLLQKKGIDISRRTITKYRKILKIPNASIRKKSYI